MSIPNSKYYIEILPPNKDLGVDQWRGYLYEDVESYFLNPTLLESGEETTFVAAKSVAIRRHREINYVENSENRLRFNL